MPVISDADRTVFAEAHNTVLDNFTEQQLEQLHAIAGQLQEILDAAKERQGSGFEGRGFGRGFKQSMSK